MEAGKKIALKICGSPVVYTAFVPIVNINDAFFDVQKPLPSRLPSYYRTVLAQNGIIHQLVVDNVRCSGGNQHAPLVVAVLVPDGCCIADASSGEPVETKQVLDAVFDCFANENLAKEGSGWVFDIHNFDTQNLQQICDGYEIAVKPAVVEPLPEPVEQAENASGDSAAGDDSGSDGSVGDAVGAPYQASETSADVNDQASEPYAEVPYEAPGYDAAGQYDEAENKRKGMYMLLIGAVVGLILGAALAIVFFLSFGAGNDEPAAPLKQAQDTVKVEKAKPDTTGVVGVTTEPVNQQAPAAQPDQPAQAPKSTTHRPAQAAPAQQPSAYNEPVLREEAQPAQPVQEKKTKRPKIDPREERQLPNK